MKKLEMAVVTWKDAMATNQCDSFSAKDLRKLHPIVMYDIGFITETPEGIVVIGNMSEEGAARKVSMIPKEMVLSVKKLRKTHE